MGRHVIIGALTAAAIGFPAYAAAPCSVAKVGEFKVTMQGTQGMVAAKLNGQDANLLVDSGAFFSSLDPASRDRLGLKRSIMPPGLIVRGVGGEARMSASGTCYGMRETSANGTYYISALGTCTGDAASTDATTLRSFT